MVRAVIEPLPLLTTGQIAQRWSVHRDTVWDWITTGLRRPDGAVVRLDASKVGGTWRSTEEAVLAFFETLKGSRPGTDGRPGGSGAIPTPTAREREARADQERVRKKLAKGRPKAAEIDPGAGIVAGASVGIT